MIWDADGVLLDSRRLAWRSAERIAAAFGINTTIQSQNEFRNLFGVGRESKVLQPDECKIARQLHRLIMRRYASEIPINSEVLAIASRIQLPSVIITSAYAETVRTSLGLHGALFQAILGRELGSKSDLLTPFSHGQRKVIGITDSVIDVERYERAGIKALLVGWGYETPDDVSRTSNAKYISAPSDLEVQLLEWKETDV